MTDTGIVLGFYRDREAVDAALVALHKERFGRCAALERTAEDKLRVHEDDVMPRQGALFGFVFGAFLSALALLLRATSNPDFLSELPSLLLLLAPLILGAIIGWLGASVFDFGVSKTLVKRYGSWVIRGEMLVLVETSPARMERAVEVMRAQGSRSPAVFVLRPGADNSGALMQLEARTTPQSESAASTRAQKIAQQNESEAATARREESQREAVRREPLTLDKLKARARRLSTAQRVATDSHGGAPVLLRRLKRSQDVLHNVLDSLSQAAQLEQNISISGEWLLDNSFLIQGQIKDVRRNLPRGFYAQLPLLLTDSNAASARGEIEMVPRVYAIATDLIANTDARLDRAVLTEYLNAYQEKAPLTIGELWAVPLMLRVALIENLRRLAVRVDERQRERERADFWASRLLSSSRRDPDHMLRLLGDMARERKSLTAHFADRLRSQLLDEENALNTVQGWLERRLEAPLAEIIQSESRRQVADQVSVSNVMSGLRALNDVDWRDIFHDTSVVEKALQNDPASVYAQMDFATRDRYRHVVESVTRLCARDKNARAGGESSSAITEIDVARAAIELAREASERQLRNGAASGGTENAAPLGVTENGATSAETAPPETSDAPQNAALFNAENAAITQSESANSGAVFSATTADERDVSSAETVVIAPQNADDAATENAASAENFAASGDAASTREAAADAPRDHARDAENQNVILKIAPLENVSDDAASTRQAAESVALNEARATDETNAAIPGAALENAPHDNVRAADEMGATIRIAPVENVAAAASTDAASNAASTRAAQNFAAPVEVPPQSHVGYYLVDDGRKLLEERLKTRVSGVAALRRAVYENAAAVYLGGIAALTIFFTLFFARVLAETPLALKIVLLILALLPASELAVQLLDYVLTRLLPPRGLSRLSFKSGIPDEWKTLVVVPMMLTENGAIQDDLDRLEARYLANKDDNLRFALLSDFTDADSERAPQDESLLEYATRGIENLNERYGDERFALLHRPRKWSEGEGKWIGWERKRGKIEELNEFLCAPPAARATWRDNFLRAGSAASLDAIRFVITLDADTQLPHDSARRLIETLAHPLNRPVIETASTRADGSVEFSLVARGYGIIQPMVSTALPSAAATRFSRLLTDARGADPYTHLISNVYQDLAGEGAYHGKGIYDLWAFQRVLAHRFPDATLLSHDLLEGAHVRVGLTSDIELFDQFPGNYLSYARRAHRWVRGDWQISDWAFGSVPGADGKRERNPLSALSRWKVFDNLRRSLVSAAAMALLIFAWLWAPEAASRAGRMLLLLFALPPLLGAFTWLTGNPFMAPFPLQGLGNAVARTFFNLALLPHQAWMALDAVGKVIYRRAVSHKNLLEWQTAQAAEKKTQNTEAEFVARLTLLSAAWFFLLLVLLSRVLASVPRGLNANIPGINFSIDGAQLIAYEMARHALWAALPFLLLWISAPLWMQWLRGGKKIAVGAQLPRGEKLYLRQVARETWRYFDDFIGPQNNWLPPDNYQEHLNIELAPRTSPTNIGLWLLSALAARDFGYVTLDQATERCLATLESMENLERHDGHLLNWYDVTTMAPLYPRYVSTVDSGNLLASLWTLSQGQREIAAQPILDESALLGLQDTLQVFNRQTPETPQAAQELVKILAELFATQRSEYSRDGAGEFSDGKLRLDALIRRLRDAGKPAYALTQVLRESGEAGSSFDPLVYWADALERQVAAWNSIIDRYLLWAVRLVESGEDNWRTFGDDAFALRQRALRSAPSLEELSQGRAEHLSALLRFVTATNRDAASTRTEKTVAQNAVENVAAQNGNAQNAAQNLVAENAVAENETARNVDEANATAENVMAENAITAGAVAENADAEIGVAQNATTANAAENRAAENAVVQNAMAEKAAGNLTAENIVVQNATAENAAEENPGAPTSDDENAAENLAAQNTASTRAALSGNEMLAIEREDEVRSAARSQWESVTRELTDAASKARWLAGEMMAQAESVIEKSERLGAEMNFKPLYNERRQLFCIGINVDENRADTAFYETLASECRLASFATIARGEIPVEHWLKLRRVFAGAPGQSPVLLSWSGTMFEYLMPLLLTPAYDNSLLQYACREAVNRQKNYARRRGIPWGISEAAYAAIDQSKTYQYHAFGVPGLGMKRGLEDDLVVAPYATALALMVDAVGSVENLHRLESIGMRGAYGFYESIDFTRQRVPEGERGVPVRTFMVHHQGMSLLAIDNVLHRDIMQRRFAADPRVRAASPLLYEGVPASPPVLESAGRETQAARLQPISEGPTVDEFGTANTPAPRINVLGNGEYSLLTTNSGGGTSRWRDFEISRWRADTTRDDWGQFLYLRDLDDDFFWSSAAQPVMRPERRYKAVFAPDRSTYSLREAGIETLTEITVSPDDDAEIRRVTITNHSRHTRRIEATSYQELSLAPHAADRAHPAFSKLFVETEFVENRGALLATRRLRAPKDKPIWAAHLTTSGTTSAGGAEDFHATGNAAASTREDLQYETDRAKFLGRGRDASDPQALRENLSGTTGAVLDPVFSLRRRFTLKPGESVRVAFVTCAGESRENVMALCEKYADFRVCDRAFELAWTNAQLEMYRLRMEPGDGQLFQHLASYLVYPSDRLRAPSRVLARNTLGQKGLWAHGISGDLPMTVVSISSERDLTLVRQVLAAHAFWDARGLKTDLVILNEEAAGYEQPLNEQLRRLVQARAGGTGLDQPGGVFLRNAKQLSPEETTLLLTVARAVLSAARGGLAQQLGASSPGVRLPARLVVNRRFSEEPSAPLPFMDLPYFNGTGGFTPDGREYAIYLSEGTHTPAPWSNVLANERFGCLVTESGAGFSWCDNSQANRLTPWNNDPVSDIAHEAIYIRDDDSGTFWTPTPLPIRENDPYRTRHGQGYTITEHNSHAIEQELATFVPLASTRNETTGENETQHPPLRVQRLKLRNASSRRRTLSVVFYAQWVLGTTPEETGAFITTQWDAADNLLLARNPYHPTYPNRVSFAAMNPAPQSFTADRTEFLGRNGSPLRPASLARQSLSGRAGAGLDPCVALQTQVTLEPGEEREIVMLLGQCESENEARVLASRYLDGDAVQTVLNETSGFWDGVLNKLQVETPDLSVNFLLNRWLIYQVLSCRVWGRSAFYQSGGAYGFRDQLQDVMALLHTRPDIAREQITRAAAHQFVEGDVLHWWHPPTGAGVRTRFADDLLWLPLVTAQYVRVTGDVRVLAEEVPFIEGDLLTEDQHETFMEPRVSQQRATVMEHCRRAIEKGLTSGPHDLPLFGIGDWNDGMSRVGVEGKGESVWMAWFLIHVLHDFAELCELCNDSEKAKWCREQAAKLAATTEREAWDGEWYKRGYFDDGSALGSHESEEAKIDSLPQTWGILSGAADPERAETAMKAVEEHLIREKDEMILLFTPPFDQSSQDPGYIKGYVPGVRENGGQYTHAAIWVAQAYARKGDGARAVQLLRMLNPVEHARTEADVARYVVEPYVVVADIYALQGRVGRGGWTWYTGSASWMYRVWIEDVLGFQRRGDTLFIAPNVPEEWREYSLHYHHGGSVYHVTVQHSGAPSLQLDGRSLEVSSGIPLTDDGAEHHVVVNW